MANIIPNSNKPKNTNGRNIVPHVSRKCTLPFPDKMNIAIDEEYVKEREKRRKYKLTINGKVIGNEQKREERKTAHIANSRYKSDKPKSKWV